MRQFFHRTFFEHPNSVDESYFQHLRFAFGFACTLSFAAMAALLHALVPCVCEHTASRKINELHQRMHNR